MVLQDVSPSRMAGTYVNLRSQLINVSLVWALPKNDASYIKQLIAKSVDLVSPNKLSIDY